MKRRRRSLAAIGVLLGVAVLAILLPNSRSAVAQSPGYTVPGCWFVDIYFGDPADPATPKLPCIASFDSSATVMWTSTGSWGEHPLMPGNKGGGQGVWERKGHTLELRGIWFDEVGGGLGLSVGRAVVEVVFNGPDELVGLADFDYVPCPDGAMGCSDPTEGDFLQMGDGVGPFPIVYRRLR